MNRHRIGHMVSGVLAIMVGPAAGVFLGMFVFLSYVKGVSYPAACFYVPVAILLLGASAWPFLIHLERTRSTWVK